MQRAKALVLLCMVAPAVASEGNPLGKTIELLNTLEAKINREGEAEDRAFSEYSEWCDDASKSHQFAIETASAEKQELEAAIAKAAADIEACTNKIEELAAAVASSENDLKAATAIREKENGEFLGGEKELVATVDTIERAMGIIEKEASKNPALVQMDPSNLSGLTQALGAVIDAASFARSDKQRLLALVQSQQTDSADLSIEAEEAALGAPASKSYGSHSGSIVDLLDDLKVKAEAELSALRKSEVSAAHNFDMLSASLKDSMASDGKNLGEEKTLLASTEGAKAAAEGDLASTSRDLKDGQSSLATVQSSCMAAAADHEASQTSRHEELTALDQAKSILEETSSGAVAQTYSLLQTATRSRLQTHADLAHAEVTNLVRSLAVKYHSAALAQLASKISIVMRYASAGRSEDPFVKVKGLIKNLIERLLSEAAEEASEKAYCDEQMAKTEAKKADLEQTMAKLSSKIDLASASSSKRKEEVKELQGELASLAKLQAEMDKARMDENAAYTKAKADLELGLSGVRKALDVLTEYYGSASLLQQSGSMAVAMNQPAPPETHSKASGAGGGIIDLLEVVESDMAKSLATEETEEGDAAATYEKMTQENKVSKVLKEQDVKYKTQKYTSLDKEISELTSDKDAESAEHDAVLNYYSKIKERCIAKPETYGQRKARRDAEIKGLKEALSILESEAALVQRRTKAAFRR